jgi:D-alanyl-D-alanine carboxypeptidase/D-alanyl-D-alanine-endopeptidase (penicillin-binding protein 4)
MTLSRILGPLTILATCVFLLAIPSISICAPLDAQIEAIISQGASARAHWGVYAVRGRNREVIANVNGGRLFVPASNRKLVSTALALETMGADHVLTTLVHVAQPPAGGVVTGDLVVRAVGDPSWAADNGLLDGRPGRSILTDIARQVSRAGVTRVTGDLVIDTSRFVEPDPIPPAWDWENMQMSFASLPSVFGINHNLGAVRVAPGRPDEPVLVSPLGSVPPFTVINRSVTGRAGSQPTLELRRSIDGRELLVRGSLSADAAEGIRSIPLGEPTLFTARELKAVLAENEVTIDGTVAFSDRSIPVGHVLASVNSVPLPNILSVTNKDSENHLAESLYLLAGAQVFGTASYRASADAEARMWRRLGVDSGDYASSDGSGLSRKNYVTPRAIVALLNGFEGSDVYVESLARTGYRGTLRYRLSGDNLRGRIRGKTGTLDGVTALSGYIDHGTERVVTFSILVNNFNGNTSTIRAKVDEIVELLAK